MRAMTFLIKCLYQNLRVVGQGIPSQQSSKSMILQEEHAIHVILNCQHVIKNTSIW